jgi:hypothetical protein
MAKISKERKAAEALTMRMQDSARPAGRRCK